MKEIELTSNCFTAIPKELSELKNLVHITTNNAEHGGISPDGKILCDNELNDFPEFLKDMPNLKSVSCFYGVNVNSELKKKIKSSFPKIKFS